MLYVSEKPCECPVCFESLKNEKKSLSCGHWVHKDCIIKSKKDTCPLCRQTIKLNKEERFKLNELQMDEHLRVEYVDEL